MSENYIMGLEFMLRITIRKQTLVYEDHKIHE